MSKEAGEISGLSLREAVAREIFGKNVKGGTVYAKNGARSGYPDYSGDIAAAWMVVEKMRGRGMRIVLTDASARGWFKAFFGDDIVTGIERGRAEAPTAPEAICRAALSAIRASRQATEERE